MEEFNEGAEVDSFRRAVARRIASESDKLVDELFNIVYDEETEAKVRLSAINTLLDRGVPKLSVQSVKEEESEEKGSRKALREEIERLMLGEEEDEEK